MGAGSPGLRTKHNWSTDGTPGPESRPKRATPGPLSSPFAARGERGTRGSRQVPERVACHRCPPSCPAPHVWRSPRSTQPRSLTAARAASRAGRSVLVARAGREGSREVGRAGAGMLRRRDLGKGPDGAEPWKDRATA